MRTKGSRNKSHTSYIGNTYGRLVVTNDYMEGKRHICECICSCGNTVKVNSWALKSGSTKSCGCLRKEKISKLAKNHICRVPLINRLRVQILQSIKGNAKTRNLTIELSDNKLWELMDKPCFYCGRSNSNHMSMNRREELEELFYNGIDRIDSSLGYLEGNVVPCCRDCNKAKQSMSVDEFKSFVIRIYNHLILKST